jgi:putative methyltransferase (TIGR04325 family)
LSSLKKILKQWTPPIIKRALKYKFIEGWHGDYRDFQTAKSKSTGYEADTIIKRVREATQKVRNGEAIYERSGVLYDKPSIYMPLLTALLYAANQNNNKLTVLDYGGALGSLYYQHRSHLVNISLNWCIVEQEAFAEIGKKEFETETLQFFSSVKECLDQYKPDLVFFCGSLQYFPDPYETVQELFQYRIPYFLVGNITFLPGKRDQVAIQKVPAFYYVASYPCWFLSKSKFLDFMEQQYDLLSSFEDDLHPQYQLRELRYEGMWFKLK